MAGSLRASSLALASTMLMVALPAVGVRGCKAALRGRACTRQFRSRPCRPAPWASKQTDAAAAGRDTVAVMIDHAKVVRLPERTQTVVVGNPMIADITVQRNGIVVVTGKSYGITNVIALDGAGTLIAESFITVQAATESVVIVQRGLERESYSCTPNCQPSILLGDSNKYFSEIGGQAGQRNGLATQR